MASKVTAAKQVLQSEGIVTLSNLALIHMAQKTSIGDEYLYKRSKDDIEKRKMRENGLDDIIDTVLDVKPGYGVYQVEAMQLREEIASLSELVADQDPDIVMEIGTHNGGTFYIWSRCFASASQFVSLDLPGGRFGGGYQQRKTRIYESFAPSKSTEFVRADSHDEGTLERISDILQGQIDFLFIDGDHTYEGVKSDFEMYKPLVSDDGIIALHDIVEHPNTEQEVYDRIDESGIEDRHIYWTESHPDCNVHQFWSELTEKYETSEFISHPMQTWGGIGVVHL